MNESPEIEWLTRKWNLPESAVEAVNILLAAETGGSTACEMGEALPAWGDTALRAHETGNSPLVVVGHNGKIYLQSRRLYEAEKSVANRLISMGEGAIPEAQSAKLIGKLFPRADSGDRQVSAARVALTRKLAMITGGPGTGKTYALARILALLSESGLSPAQIRLAAPTGKAADRMKRAVLESLDGLPKSFVGAKTSLAEVAAGSSTIHSLIGYNPGLGRTKFDAQSPLNCSVVILDECSMIDLLLWRALLESLRPDCRLILLGDPNQLESVGQGSVFAELSRMASPPKSPLHSCHVHLTEARRFKERSGILELAKALEQSDADGAERILKSCEGISGDRGIVWIEMREGAMRFDDFPPPIVSALEAVADAQTPEEALEALGQVCVLTAQREYFVGAKAISQAIEAGFASRQGGGNHPIIINQNDPETGLRNGSIGVIHVDEEGKRKAWFPSLSGTLQELPVGRLPDFSPAWAITIHRSQGSEYENVLVILPHEHSPLTTRELLYTAITRARHTVFVAGSLSSVRKAVLTPSSRTTLLDFHLNP